MQPAQLHIELRAEGDHYLLQLRADKLVRGIWIGFNNADASVEDNAFDLLPGQTRTLIVRSTAPLSTLRTALHLQTLGDTLQSRPVASQDNASVERIH